MSKENLQNNKKKNKTNKGKLFENRFKRFFDKRNIFIQRIVDTAKGYKGSGSKADFIVFMNNQLFLFECKSHLGKSLPIGCISDKQIIGLIQSSQMKDVKGYLIIEFRDIEQCFAIDINNLFYLEEHKVLKKNKKDFTIEYIIKFKLERKSIPIDYIIEHGILITNEKNRFLEDMILNL